MSKRPDKALVERVITAEDHGGITADTELFNQLTEMDAWDSIAITHMAERRQGKPARCLAYPETWNGGPCAGCTAPLD